MDFLNKIINRIHDLEEKDFYKYLTVIGIVLLLFISFFIFRYYRNVSYFKGRIEEINERREADVRNILSRMEDVKKRREEVNAILAQEELFKIEGYFINDLLQTLGIGKPTESTVSKKELGELEYTEVELNARFTSISTEQMCRLLKELEEKKRINIKELEIKKSAKNGRAIDVSIKIATLQPKVEEAA